MLRESRGMHDRARTEAVDRLMSEMEIFFFLALWFRFLELWGMYAFINNAPQGM